MKAIYCLSILFFACATTTPVNHAEQKNSSAVHAEAKAERASVQKTVWTAENNPTTRGGRGEPSLDDKDRPAAWAFIDGREGKYQEENGKKLMQWVIETPISNTPSFRVDVYEPLLGEPTNFQAVIQSEKLDDGSMAVYTIRAEEGSFKVGQDYSLLAPGPNFTLTDKMTNQTLESIPPLKPGRYGFVAGIKNLQMNQEGLAITYFIVR